MCVCVCVCVCIDQIAHSSAQYGRILFPSDYMLQYSQWSSKGGIDGICCRENYSQMRQRGHTLYIHDT